MRSEAAGPGGRRGIGSVDGGRPGTAAILLLVVLLTATFAATLATTRMTAAEHREEIDRDAHDVLAALDRRVVAYTEVLVGLRGVFEIDPPSHERYARFVRGLQLAARYPGVTTVSYAEAVDPVDRGRFEVAVREKLRRSRAGYPPFAIHPAAPRRRQVVIDYLEPISSNGPALGFDLLSEPSRAAAVRLTQMTGRPAVTGPISLIQDGQQGFLIMLAVREGGASLRDPSAGRFRGVVTAAFHVEEFLERALPDLPQGAEVEVYDLGSAATAADAWPRRATPMYSTSGRFAAHQRSPDPTRYALEDVDVAGRRWMIAYSAPTASATSRALPWMIGLAGTLIALLGSGLLLAIGRGRASAVALARQTTVDLRDAQARYRTAFDAAPIGMAIVGLDGRWLQVNHALRRMLGHGDAPLPEQLQHVTHPDDRPTIHAAHERLLEGTIDHCRLEARFVRPDGSTIAATLSISLVRDDRGEPLHFVCQSEDITELRRSEGLFRDLLEAAPEATVIVDDTGCILLTNTQTELLLGYRADELVGQPVELLIPERLRERHGGHRADYGADPHTRPMGSGHALHARHKDGREIPVEVSLAPLETERGRLVSAVIRDVTLRKEEEARLRYLAEHDTLTGLRNRGTFEVDLAREAARARRHGEGAVLLVDIDGLKLVNDTLGHQQGDELIRSVATLIAGRVRGTDTVARIGGDEFAVLMPDTTAEAAHGVALELLQSIRDHGIVLGAQRQRLTASIGVAGFGSLGPAIGEDIMVAADLALYEAKESGRDRVSVYRPHATETAERTARESWSRRIRSALDDGRLIAVRQPIMRLDDRAIAQYELLVRMHDERGELIPPSAFLPTAERSGLVRDIDRFMIATAIDLLAQLPADDPLSYEVNLSARSLEDETLPAAVAARLRESGVDPSRLVFEITETAAIANMDQARRFADALRELGCKFALDDFGAGFASFYYLKHMPLDFLKIDGDFVRSVARNRTDQVVVRHIAEIARTLGMRTIAECIEDEETLDVLRGLGVDLVQGFHLGRPEPLPTPARALTLV